VAALIAAATLVPALTAAVVLADLQPSDRTALRTAVADEVWVLALGLVLQIGLVAAVAWGTWRAEQRTDRAVAGQIDVIARANPGHRLPATSAVAAAVNRLAERHEQAEARLAGEVAAAHDELRRERDGLLAVLTGLDVPVGVVDDAGRILLANPAARRELPGRTPVAAGRSIFGVFDAEDFVPLLQAALAGRRPSAVVAGTPIRLALISTEPPMVVVVGEAADVGAAPEIGLSVDLSRPARDLPPRPQWPDVPLASMVFTVLDCETTGLHVDAGDRLVALGAVRVDRGSVRADDTFDTLIDPGRSIPATSTQFHGITDAMVAGAPAPAAAIESFTRYAADSVLVGHQLAFDLGFLRATGVPLETCTLDTMLLAAVLDPHPDARLGLDAVCERYGVPVVGRHTALGDALATAEVFVRMLPLLAASGVVTVGDAISASARTDVAKRLSRGG
jgi:DNA polymerase III epsilon subunit family exonuclease